MNADEIRQHVTAVPFREFVLHVADGRTIPVHGRDFILISPRGLTVDVYQPDERHDILDAALISGIAFAVPPAASQSQSSNP